MKAKQKANIENYLSYNIQNAVSRSLILKQCNICIALAQLYVEPGNVFEVLCVLSFLALSL